MPDKFNYKQIQGVNGNKHVTDEFIEEVEKMSNRMQTKPQYILAAMSFETGATFNPGIQNRIGATGLIQFLKSTAIGLGTTTAKLKDMTSVEQLKFVEKYFKPFKGKLDTLEAVYTSILSGSPKKPNDVLFKFGTAAYKMNPLDWNNDGKITAAEATTIVAARLFGGVQAVQERLFDLGFVKDKTREGFADGRWGKNTSDTLTAFQKTKSLEETGLMNEETGAALFGDVETPVEVKVFLLKRNDKGADVEKLHDDFVRFGYMDREKIGNGFGSYGPMTETAVKKFQKDLKFKSSGQCGELERGAIDKILAGIAKGSTEKEIVEAIQNQLVKHKCMTRAQVNTGPGIFGNQTLAAVKQFQKNNMFQESGIVEAENFKILFNSVVSGDDDFSIAKNGKFYDVVPDILMTNALEPKVAKLAKIYFDKKGSKITITSGYRPPDRQATAMFDKIKNEGTGAVRSLYRNKRAVDQIINAFRANQNDREKAIEAMTETISNQTAHNIFISSHLRSNALDVRKTANLTALQNAVNNVGGRIVVESNHYHLELH